MALAKVNKLTISSRHTREPFLGNTSWTINKSTWRCAELKQYWTSIWCGSPRGHVNKKFLCSIRTSSNRSNTTCRGSQWRYDIWFRGKTTLIMCALNLVPHVIFHKGGWLIKDTLETFRRGKLVYASEVRIRLSTTTLSPLRVRHTSVRVGIHALNVGNHLIYWVVIFIASGQFIRDPMRLKPPNQR